MRLTRTPFVFLLLAILASHLKSQSLPCANDTVRTHAAWYPDTTIAQMPIPCMADTCVSCDFSLWLDMPDTMGILAVRAAVGQTIRIQIYDGCHWLLLDTCMAFAFSPVIAFEMMADWRGKPYTVRICASQSAGLELMFKPGKVVGMPPQDSLALIDTLCGALEWVKDEIFMPHTCNWHELDWLGDPAGPRRSIPLGPGLYGCCICDRKILVLE